MVNRSSKVKGGPFTRYDPADPQNKDKKSVLDLCIVSNDLKDYIDEFIIDKERIFTPFRPVGSKKVVYTDHYSCLLVLKGIPIKSATKTHSKKITRWNTNKEGGWNAYKELIVRSKLLEEVGKDVHSDSNKLIRNIDKGSYSS